MNLYALVALVMVLVTVGLGVLQYQLGKKQKTRLIGSIVPVGYFVMRVLMALFTSDDTTAITTSIVGSLIIAAIYYFIYSVTKKRHTTSDSNN